MSTVAGLAALVLMVANIWWIVGALLLFGVVHVVRQVAVSAAAQRELARQQGAVVAARADREHAQVLAGDERGVYGQYPPAA